MLIGSASPAILLRFLTGVFGAGRVSEIGGGLSVDTGGGSVTVLGRPPSRTRFPGRAPDRAPNRPHFAAYRVAVKDLGLAKDLLDGTGVPSQWHGETVQIGAADLFGVALELSEGRRMISTPGISGFVVLQQSALAARARSAHPISVAGH